MLYDQHTPLKKVLENPIGADLIDYLFKQLGLSKWQHIILNPLVLRLKLRQLPYLLKGYIDHELVESICMKMNHYNKERLPAERETVTKKWWKEAVCYQVYPRSFYDANNDGIGDLRGIISKLDYLEELGINLIWLSPIYDSPNDDNGYDIRDYHKIHEEFGTMEDFDLLLKEAHRRGIRVIMDLVINHTSDEHPWFVASKQNKTNPFRDFYFWRDGKHKGPPNNWSSIFQGDAWGYSEETEQYYLHLFSSKQVDLNWESEQLREKLYEMVRWWLDKGIDGFRLDVISFISKETGLPEGSVKLGDIFHIYGIEHYMFGPKVHDYIRELHEETFANYDVMTVGECIGIGKYMSQYFTHEDRKELNMIFNFDHMDEAGKTKWDIYDYNLNYLKEMMLSLQEESTKSTWATLFIENHDNPRILSKIGATSQSRDRIAKLISVMMLTLKGTPFIYQGQEIGMMNPGYQELEDFKDIETLNVLGILEENELSKEAILRLLNNGSRDNARAPLSWNGDVNAGFTKGQPWIPISQDYQVYNIEAQRKDPNSIYNTYRTLIWMRKKYQALIYGEFHPLEKQTKDVFAYERRLENQRFIIVMNLANKTKRLKINFDGMELVYSNVIEANKKGHNHYAPYEARIYFSDAG